MSSLRVAMVGMVVILFCVACGDASDGPTPPPASISSSSPGVSPPGTGGPDALDPVVAWCAEQTVDFCRWGLEAVGFERTPERLECLVASSSMDEFVNSECNRELEPPPTTIPETTVTSLPVDRAELASVERWMRQVLLEAHPNDPVEAGVVLAEPAVLADAVGLVTSLGAEPFAVWRRDWACFDPYATNGLSGRPKQAVRFAFLDGSAEAVRLRAAAGASGEPIFGHDLFEAQLTLLVLASEAIHEPGVEIEALVAGIPPRDLAVIENAPAVVAVRVLHSYDRGIWPGDLTPADVPNCD
ncbi:MAG: hypothetical protein OEP52_02455 [Acidimicrobiia bacterium]|nr:hypothetical protein [Acidimicrobiia bacterium]